MNHKSGLIIVTELALVSMDVTTSIAPFEWFKENAEWI